MYIRTFKYSIIMAVLLAALFTMVACSSGDDDADSITDKEWQWETLTESC
jgi:hypothetical protein